MRISRIALLLLLSGCFQKQEGGLKIAVSAMPTTLDWSRSDTNSWANYPVMMATLRGLTVLDSEFRPQPGLAKSWTQEVDRDGSEVYTFHLRDDVRWSDGTTPLTANDFVFGFRRALLGREGGELADIVGAREVLRKIAEGEKADPSLLSVHALDDWTFQLRLERPRSYFLHRLANVYIFFPAPSAQLSHLTEQQIQSYFDEPKDGHPLSLGPYRVRRWDRAGERLTLKLVPTSSFLPAAVDSSQLVQELTLLRSEIAPALFERHRIAFVSVDSPLGLRRAEGLMKQPLLSTYFVGFNTERAPFDRSEIREAFANVIDCEELFESLLPDARTTEHLIPGLLRPKQARTREQDSRNDLVPSEVIRLIYRQPDSFLPENAIAQRLQRLLLNKGWKVELDARHDFTQELSRLAPDGKRPWNIYLRRIGADYAHPNSFFTLFKRNGNHQTAWESLKGGTQASDFETLLNQADAESTEGSLELYAKAEDLLVQQARVVVPLFHPDRYYRVAPNLKGLGMDPFNFLSISNLTLQGSAP